MGKGFVVDKELRKERNAVCTNYEDTIAWAVANRPGAVPINASLRRRYADTMRNAYARFKKEERKTNKKFRLGRYTRPRPKAAPMVQPEPSEKNESEIVPMPWPGQEEWSENDNA